MSLTASKSASSLTRTAAAATHLGDDHLVALPGERPRRVAGVMAP